MDARTFDRGWKALMARYHLAADDVRFEEYFRHLKDRIPNGAWLAVCDHLALTNDDNERDRFLPVVGNLLAIASRYTKDGMRKTRGTYCGDCYDGHVFFARCEIRFNNAGDQMHQPIVANIPPDAQRSLEWFNRMPAYPMRWAFYLSSVVCDCRRDILEEQRVGDNPRPWTYSEVLGFHVPPKDNQDANGVIDDHALMLSETFPKAASAMAMDARWRYLEIRRKYRGDLVYEVPLWALQLGGIGGRVERPAPSPEVAEKPAPTGKVPSSQLRTDAPRTMTDALDRPKPVQDRRRAAGGDVDDDDRPWEG